MEKIVEKLSIYVTLEAFVVPFLFKIQIRPKTIQLIFRSNVALKLRLRLENTESSYSEVEVTGQIDLPSGGKYPLTVCWTTPSLIN